DGDPVMRATAAEALGRMKSPRVGAALVGALTDRNDAVRRAAVSALADMEERSAVGPIEGLLLNDPNAEVRRESASALGNLSLARSIEPLARALGDQDIEVQREAANAIGDLDHVTNAPAALVRATTSPDLELRRHATKALAHIGDLAPVQALADRLNDDDKEPRLAAVESPAPGLPPAGPPTGPPPHKVVTATRIAAGAIRLDGRLDDPAWAEAHWITDFTQKMPHEGAPPSDSMRIALLYDGDALYV